MNLQDLKKQIPFQWVITSISKDEKKACLCPYIDARDAMDLLDEVVGAENWQDKYYHQGVNTYCEIGIKIGNEWVWKSDTGSIGSMNIEPEKSLASDAFKRSAVKWGVGRFLYSIDPIWLNYDKPSKRVYDNANFSATQYEKEKINKYCNDLYNKNNNKVKTTPAPTTTHVNTVQVKDNSSDIAIEFEKSQKKADLLQKIEECKNLTHLKNVVEKHGFDIEDLQLDNIVKNKRNNLWKSWFNSFTNELSQAFTVTEINIIEEKHKYLIASNEYKEICQRLIEEAKIEVFE